MGIWGWRNCTCEVSYEEDVEIKLGIEAWASYAYPQLFWVEVCTKMGPLGGLEELD